MKGFLTEEHIGILRETHYSCRMRKSADRIKTILFLNEGFSHEQTAQLLMLDSTTIRRYKKEYEKLGVDGLIEYRYFGSHGFLTKTQKIGLITHLKNHTYQTVKEICLYAIQHYIPIVVPPWRDVRRVIPSRLGGIAISSESGILLRIFEAKLKQDETL